MACSEARLAANRANAAKSTGPSTEAGKARSRANAIKHGLTGEGLALPVEVAAEVEQCFIGVRNELAPQTVLGSFLAHQIALNMVRCKRSARGESKILAMKIRRAPAEFDETRAAEADHLMGWIGSEPVAYRRKLMATPEGIDRLVAALHGLRDELNGPQIVWNYNHAQKLAAFCGTRETDIPYSRGRRLSDAVEGRYTLLDPAEIAHLTTEEDRRNWASDQLVAYIEAEVATLEAHRSELDLEGIALDRAEAGERAMTDQSKEFTLNRKYEAAALRGFYRAIQEFRKIEATGSPDLTEGPASDEATLETGDEVKIAEVGETPEPPKSIPKSDLERSLASFEHGGPTQAAPLGRLVDAPRPKVKKCGQCDSRC